MPIRNEAAFLSRSLGAVLEQDYPTHRLEVVLADGMSTDGTRSQIGRLAEAHPAVPVTIVDNPGQIVPTGFNEALVRAKGDVIVRVDGHTIIAPDYVRECVAALHRSGADNVGGRMDPVSEGLFGQSAAFATASRFGVGGARFHYSDREEWVDTVYMGAWPRQVFETIGLFDEEQVRNQDDEFNYRLRKRGGKILLSPRIKSRYYNRSTLRSLWRQYFQYGYWKVRVMQKHPVQMRPRHFVPPLFVAALLSGVTLAPFSSTWEQVFKATIFAYGVASLLALLVVGAGKPLRIALLLPATFAILHLSYGLGFLVGLIRFAGHWRDRANRWATHLQLAASAPLYRPDRPATERPLVSVVVPCRNEEQHIAQCLDSIVASTYPADRLEVIVADGRSEDRTREIVADYSARYPWIRLLDNPKRIASTALNGGIRHASGDLIVRMDAHTIYPPDYLAQLVSAMEETGADNVGGRLVTLPANSGLMARAIARALSHPFGVGNARFRIGARTRRWVDTVPFGCFRRELFDRVGVFDEELIRNQDDEFNFRVVRRGGRILLDPSIVARYYARASLRQLARMYYQYGYFKPLVAVKVRRVMTVRQLVPPLFLGSLVGAGLTALVEPAALPVFSVVMASYAGSLIGGTVLAARGEGGRFALALLAAFATLHASYGVGFLRGVYDLAVRRRRVESNVPSTALGVRPSLLRQ